jgi:predicted CoA-binding protein
MPVESDDQLREILSLDTIAVVGCSTTPGKAAHDIPRYMREHGYDVIPVNPYADEVFGRHAYDSLADVEETVDIVDVFRPSEEVPDIVDEALAREDVQVAWLQLGITHDEAGRRVEDDGRLFVQDRCLKVEYQRLLA